MNVNLLTHLARSLGSGLFLLLCGLALGFPTPLQAQVYLPLVAAGQVAPPPPPPPPVEATLSSIQLIEQALLFEQINPEQALLYRVQAVVGDSALPSQFLGNDDGLDGSAIMAALVATIDSLPAATQAQLRPYLLPPAAAGSWYAAQQVAAAGAGATAEWDTVTTANGKVKVWYHPETASHAARAVAIANAIDSTIWPKLTAWMQAPLPDCGAACPAGGGDDRIDLYLVNVRRNYTQPFTCCNGSSGFAILRPDSSFALVARDLMYLIEYSYPMASIEEYRWLMSASAQFAMHYVYPQENNDPDYPRRNEEHRKAGDFLYRTLWPLETVDDGHEFGAYLFYYWIDDVSTVPDVWQNATMPNSLANVDQQMQGGFRQGWPQFAVENWNREPVDFYRRTDELTIGPETADEYVLSEPGTEEFILEIDHLTSYYLRFTFPDRSLKRIAVFNPIAGAGEPTAALWAIMKIDGTWRAPQDWTNRSHEIFCRDEPNQNLEELILVPSNSEWQDRNHVVKTDNGSVRVSPDCGGLLTGTFTLNFSGNNQLPSGSRGSTDQTTVVNVRLRYDEEREDYLDDGSTFSHSGTVYDEAHEVNTGELGWIMEYTESGSGDFNQGGALIKGSVHYGESEDGTWVGAKIRYRKSGTITYYPSGESFPIDAEETMTLLCNDPTGVRGVRNENGVFDLSCTAETTYDTGSQRLNVAGSLALQ